MPLGRSPNRLEQLVARAQSLTQLLNTIPEEYRTTLLPYLEDRYHFACQHLPSPRWTPCIYPHVHRYRHPDIFDLPLKARLHESTQNRLRAVIAFMENDMSFVDDLLKPEESTWTCLVTPVAAKLAETQGGYLKHHPPQFYSLVNVSNSTQQDFVDILSACGLYTAKLVSLACLASGTDSSEPSSGGMLRPFPSSLLGIVVPASTRLLACFTDPIFTTVPLASSSLVSQSHPSRVQKRVRIQTPPIETAGNSTFRTANSPNFINRSLRSKPPSVSSTCKETKS